MNKGLEISLSYIPVINFALQQNHVPVIREIVLRNTGEEQINDIDLVVRFEPEFALEYTQRLDSIAPGKFVKISVVPISVSTEFLASLTERIAGTVNLTARSGDELLAEKHCDISILTFNEWGGSCVMPESLAAFSTPNHPGVAVINKKASEFLGKWTGDPSLNAYQNRDHNRVKFQMAAIYEAIAEKMITYCVSPASFESHGQRIRTVDEIISLKMGNCLDMTMLYASCLEAAGLHPLIILTDDHAFAGCWLTPDSFPDSVVDDPALITKRMADGMNEILVVECTAMNEGSHASFDKACDAAKQKMMSGDVSFFIDVCRARIGQVRPLPLRTVDDKGNYVIEDTEVERVCAAPTEMSATDLIIDTEAVVSRKTIWERKLLDLTLRNNLLNLKVTRGNIPFISANIGALEDALANNEDFIVCPKPTDWDCELLSDGLYKTINATDPIHELIQQELRQNRIHAYLDEETLRKSLTHLYRTAKTSMEENGANTLYLAIGLLKWFETPTSQKPRYAPILLVPVEIVRKSASSGYVVRSRDEDTMLNITMLELLRQMFDITIGGLEPLPKDVSGIDTSLVFNTIRTKIMEQRNWDVVEQAVLGNFSFNKFIMWNDIHNNSDVLCESPIVSSLMSGVVDPSINVEIKETEDLDKKFRAGDILLPISADSSQIEAITAALSGKSYILHGPPGTGKSQTITNIIANALYRGKKVLFVAEKMAALEVVQNRLNSIGLGPFCLELHSNKAKKSTVLAQLKRTSEVAMTKSPEEYRVEAEHINSVRDEMNACIQTLHKAYPLGLSLYDCISRYTSIDESCPEFDMTASKAETVTGDMVARMEVALDELKAVLNIIGNPSENPLRGIDATEYNASVENALNSLPQILSLIESLEHKVQSFREQVFNTPSGDIIKEEYDFLMELCYPLTTEGFHASILGESECSLAAIEDAVEKGVLRDPLRKLIVAEYGEDLLEINVKEYETQWRDIQSKMALVRFFSGRKFLKRLATYCSKPVPAEQVLSVLKQVKSFQEADRFIADLNRSIAFVRSVINGYDTDWAKVRESCVVARSVRSILGKRIADRAAMNRTLCALASILKSGGSDVFNRILDEREVLRERLAIAIDKLGARMPEPAGDVFAAAIDLISRWYNGRDKIRSWVLYNKHKENICTIGFGEIAEQIETCSYGPDAVKDAFHKALYKAYAEHILTMEPDLQLFHGVLFEEKIRRFRGLCKDFETLAREELFAQIASSLPAFQKEASQNSEVGILQRNIRNGCRGVSLRNFFASIQDLLHRMCPCMLMSPMSVAQYIEAGGMKFDLVIFDEASQMPTCEAVGTIARGSSVIVVGDPKQLPPTTFFNATSFDEDNSHIEDLESILDDCLALTLPSKYLRWHYRSKHESLIAFSNSKYYENKLHTFPSPDDLCTKIGYQHVEGVYDRGGSRQNKAEAEAIIKDIERRLDDPILSKMSIGVVTFNTNQQSLLEDMLNDLFVKRPDLEKIALECEEPIFIKNLENVQGDERDVILFSIGYGQDKAGKVTLNFGPLNREGGWRRLNVAVSRARYEMKVFSTLRSEQIDLRRTSAEGVAGLKEFLEYAERGVAAGASESVETVPASSSDGFVEAVAKAIREKGYEARTNIGSSGYKIDIGIVNPLDSSSYVLGILCDGYNYASSRSARDREIVQVGVLRKLGWKIWRLWALDWWSDKDAAVRDICAKIDDAIAGSYVEVEEEPIRLYNSGFTPTVEPVNNNSTSTSQLLPYSFADLAPFPLSAEGVVNGFYDELIKGYIREVIEIEAPIKHDLLCKRVLRAVDIARMGPRMSAYMQSIIDSMNLKTTQEAGPVYWKDSQNPQDYCQIRYSNEREAMHIPDMESKNAALYVLRQQGAMPFESLVREMGKTFGYSRTGDNVYMAMRSGIELAARLSLIDLSSRERVSVK
ncbi:MAG: DUF3320 domain-containing protein [Bacteroidales bacterium]|nr:DUF3320 domain-containing protein [Bacteroidales bacterium]